MGGIPQTSPKPMSLEELKARLIEIGNKPMRVPHTIYVVEDLTDRLAYPDRSLLDNILSQNSPDHLETYQISMHHMIALNVTFYRDKQAALEDAEARISSWARSMIEIPHA